MKKKKAVKFIMGAIAAAAVLSIGITVISGAIISDAAPKKADMKYSVGIETDGDQADIIPVGIGLRGDADGDEKLTARDAALIARYRANVSMNPNYLPDFENSLGGTMADVDTDGKVSVRDAAAISRYLSQKYSKPDIKWEDVLK